MPYFKPRRRNACTTVAERIAPVAPSGWPRVADHRQRLGGERLVQLDPVDVLQLQAGVAQRDRNRFLRSDAHDLGRHAANGEGDEARQRLQVEALYRPCARQQQRTGAVRGLRAVAGGHAALGGERRLQLGQRLCTGVGARTFVECDAALFGFEFMRAQVGDLLEDLERRDFVAEFAGLLRGDRALVRGQCELVLRLARDFPALSDLFRRNAHAERDAHILVGIEDVRVERRLVARHRHHAHRFDAAGQHDVGLAHADPVGRDRDCIQTGRAVAVHRDATHRVGQPCQQRGIARDVHALLALRKGAADHGVLDRGRIERWHLSDRRPDRRHQQIVRPNRAQRAPGRLAHRRAGRRHHERFFQILQHDWRLLSYAPACRSATSPSSAPETSDVQPA